MQLFTIYVILILQIADIINKRRDKNPTSKPQKTDNSYMMFLRCAFHHLSGTS